MGSLINDLASFLAADMMDEKQFTESGTVFSKDSCPCQEIMGHANDRTQV
jgi:hypothetical protein